MSAEAGDPALMTAADSDLVRDHMTHSVVAVAEATRLPAVLETLQGMDVSCALVFDEPGGPPSGVVSLSDLARVSKFVGGTRDPLALLPPDFAVRDVMTPRVIEIDETASIGEAARMMLHNRVSRLFVRSGGRVRGVFSTRDALRVVHSRRLDRPLRGVMTAPVESIAVGDSIDAALEKLDATELRGLVVVDGPRPIGVFTQFEAIRARALPTELRGNPVEEIMSYEALTLDAEVPVYRAAGHAIAMRTRRILVVEGESLVGIVTGYDLAQVLS